MSNTTTDTSTKAESIHELLDISIRALNQIPRFKVPALNSDSYKLVSSLESCQSSGYTEIQLAMDMVKHCFQARKDTKIRHDKFGSTYQILSAIELGT